MLLIPGIVLGVSVLGGLLGFHLQRKRSMPTKKTQLNVQLDPSDYKLIRTWAGKNDMTISEYVRKTLVESVPVQEKNHVNGNSKSVVDMAFETLESQDETDTGGCMPLPPSRQAQKGVVSEADRTHPLQRVTKVQPLPLPQVPPGPHACGHLSANVPSNLRGTCQGVCSHMQQRGRPCYWTPTTARSCPLFEDKRHEARERLVRLTTT